MSFLQRIKNLAELSKLEVKDDALIIGEERVPIKKKQMARVIYKEDPINEFLK